MAKKVKPVLVPLPDQFRIVRRIVGDPLADMPPLSPHPPLSVPTGRYTQERKDAMDKLYGGDFLWPDERGLLHQLIMQQNNAFVWNDEERGQFREDFFPPVVIPTIPHRPWVQRNIPIPLGLFDEACAIMRRKEAAGVYEPSNLSYRSRWFCVVKKGGKSLHLVHSLPLNAVTIAYSGVPPFAEQLAESFADRACSGALDVYVGHDERKIAEESRDLTTFHTPFGACRLVTLHMGWADSVAIFHEDACFVIQAEIPHITQPFSDDVPVRGPAKRYELRDGDFKTIPDNPGIRLFVWEHLNNTNRVVQRMKFRGGTYSGLTSVLIASEYTVVGHRCTYKDCVPELSNYAKIVNWGPCHPSPKSAPSLELSASLCRSFRNLASEPGRSHSSRAKD